MRKTFGKWKSLDRFFRAFLILALLFLAVGLGTLGSPYGTGGVYELRAQQESDGQLPAVVFRLSNITKENEDGTTSTTYLRLVGVYVNVAEIYTEDGTPVTLRVERRTSSGTSYTSALNATLENFYTPEPEEGETPVEAIKDPFFRFLSPFTFPSGGWRVSTYPRIRLSVSGGNVLLNEVVFLGEKLDPDDTSKGTGEMCVIPASVEEATPYANESAEEAAARAQKTLLDAQRMPASSESSFVNYKEEELPMLMTLAEMRTGDRYATDAGGAPTDVYRMDTASGALGIDIIALGTLIFGMSPFGLRFFPMLFAFFALVAFSRFTARLLKSEKAGFAFALLFSLSCITLGVAQLGIPLMIGIGFFALALDLVHRFYAKGMGKTVWGACPLLLAGLFGAAAICTAGGFVVPVAGVAALFALGLVRQQKAKRYQLEKALVPVEGESEHELKARVSGVLQDYRFRNAVAPAFFFTGLLLGAFLLAVLGMLPVYYVYLKFYAGPQGVTNVFALAWHSFANGFTGNYGVSRLESWNFFHTVYRGTGTPYAVTGVVVNLAAMLAAVIGIGVAAVCLDLALFSKQKGKERRNAIRACAIPLAGLLLAIVVAAALPYALGFLTLAYIFAFILGAKAWNDLGTVGSGKAQKVVGISMTVLLGVFFALSAVFVFSVPLPASFMNFLFK